MTAKIDDIDRKILSLLLSNAVTPKTEISRQIGLAPSGISERIRKLEDTGIIKAYETRINPAALGFPLLAFIFIQEQKPNPKKIDTAAQLAKVDGVEEVHKIAGEDCFLVKIRAMNTDELGTILDTQINTISTVSNVKTTIVLRTQCEGPTLGGRSPFPD